jgi:hypothetical protein
VTGRGQVRRGARGARGASSAAVSYPSAAVSAAGVAALSAVSAGEVLARLSARLLRISSRWYALRCGFPLVPRGFCAVVSALPAADPMVFYTGSRRTNNPRCSLKPTDAPNGGSGTFCPALSVTKKQASGGGKRRISRIIRRYPAGPPPPECLRSTSAAI